MIVHLLMPRDPFQLSSAVTSQYTKTFFFLEKVSGKSPESFPETFENRFKKTSYKNAFKDFKIFKHDNCRKY